ncbi:MAG TPA: oligosaccharide flippase family protein [Pyrinomonadaceae bacterium]|jgi:O-antigen/teichoic acid export membrane protein
MSGELNRKNEPAQKKRFVANAFFSSLAWLMPLILGFVATPIVLKKLGDEDYGLFSLILGFISYSFTFGIGKAVTKYVAEYRNLNKNVEISEIISATFWFSIILGFVAALAIVPFSTFIVADVLQIADDMHDEAITGLYIACATICFLMIGQVFQGVVQALHRFDRSSLLITVNGILLSLGNIALVGAGFRLNGLLVWNLAATTVNSLLFYHSAKRFLPEFQINLRVRASIVKLIFKYGIGIIGYQIFGNILLIFERSWITRNLGADNLTYYVVPMSLAIYLHGLIGSLILVVFPAFSELRAERARLLSLYVKATKIIFALVVFLAVNLICASSIFLKIWISEDFSGKSHRLLIVHVATFGLIALMSVMWQLAEGLGHPRYNALTSFIWLIIAVPLMIFSIEYWQNLGVAMSRLIGVFVTFPLIFCGEKLFFGAIQRRLWLKLALNVVPAAGLTAFAEYQIFQRFQADLITLIGGGIAGAFIYGLVLWKGNLFENREIIALFDRKQN